MNAAMRLSVVVAVAVGALSAQAKVLTIRDFATDPSGPNFLVEPIPVNEGLSKNLAGPPVLTFGVTSVPDPVQNCLQMNWRPAPEGEHMDSMAGWRIRFLEDPDIRNNILTISILPPGGPIANPAPPPAQLFVGVSNVVVGVTDANGLFAGGWGFNTDQVGLLGVPANDPLAVGGISLYNNVMHTVQIQLLNGPTPGSALATGGILPPRVGPNFILAPQAGASLANAATLDFYENGNLRGQLQIPGQGTIPGQVNYWDSVNLVPEPAGAAVLGMAGLLLLRRRR